MKSPIKIRVDIEQDMQYAKAGLGKRYKVAKWVFERKTGRTIEHHLFSQVFSWKDAHQLKHDIVNSYKNN